MKQSASPLAVERPAEEGQASGGRPPRGRREGPWPSRGRLGGGRTGVLLVPWPKARPGEGGRHRARPARPSICALWRRLLCQVHCGMDRS